MSNLVSTIVALAISTTTMLLALFLARRGIRKENIAKAVSDALLAQSVETLASNFTDFKVKFDQETGGNSGGMREAINRISDKQERIKVTLADEARKSELISGMVHELHGSFQQLNSNWGKP